MLNVNLCIMYSVLRNVCVICMYHRCSIYTLYFGSLYFAHTYIRMYMYVCRYMYIDMSMYSMCIISS